MIINIQKNLLLENLSKASRIIDQKTFNPSLLGVFLEATDQGLIIISSRGEQSIKIFIKADNLNLTIKQPGKLLLKAKYLLEILRRLDDFNITMTSVDTNQLRISGNNVEFNLNTMSSDAYPLLGFFEKGDQIIIDANLLKIALTQTSISVNELNKKIVLSGLNFNIQENLLYISGTDSYRLSRKSINIKSFDGDPFAINIPLKSINEIIKLIDENKENIKIIKNDEHVAFIIDNVIFQSTLLIGQFPDINSAFPTDFNSVISLGNKEFAKVIQRADITSDESNTTVVNFSLQGNKITVTSVLSEIGNFEEEFSEFDLEGFDEQMLSFNAKYFLDAIRTFNTKIIKIKIIEKRKPILISSDEDPELIQMVLPMLIS
ncbi:DNA polymerase III subunit beta [Spiroplasma endosymbiont of Labia minor]|uniref:DNA polymerase III subunit beta n=1 Tax=Spiroplasma endosymbiont of Labia minor TaxID=3066305 RepID=UPI0030CE4394